MNMQAPKRSAESGIAFILITVLVIFSVGLVGAFFSTSFAKVRHVRQQESELAAYNGAEAAMNIAVGQAWIAYSSASPSQRFDDLLRFLGEEVATGPTGTEGNEGEGGTGGTSEEGDVTPDGGGDDGGVDGEGEVVGDDGWTPLSRRSDLRPIGPIRTLGSTRCQAFVREVYVTPGVGIDVEFVSVGQNPNATRTLVQGVRFGLKVSKVFDNAYFINNFGWLWGAGITINGSARANGNVSLKSPVVNGDVYAAENPEIGAEGVIEGDYRMKELDWYNQYYDDRVRPTNPSYPSEDLNDNGELDEGEDANENGELDTYEYIDGFNGRSETRDRQALVEMPYLGDLSTYRSLAVDQGGTLSQGGKVIVDAVLGDDVGEEKNLAVIGTEDDPIVISGPVVIENDMVLRGYITGHGTIYAGRNVHLIGDVKYLHPPQWTKPMADPDAVWKANQEKDLVGYCAKGCIILGDYTKESWSSVTQKYQSPPFTQPYAVDPTDSGIGYVSYYDDTGRPVFNGDYRAFDGGTKTKDWDVDPSAIVPGSVSRKFFESSFADEYIASIAGGELTQIDGVLYTNHLISGKIGSCTINGALVCRDEALVYHGSIFMNYDVRVRYQNYEFLESFLPREPMQQTLYFRQGL